MKHWFLRFACAVPAMFGSAAPAASSCLDAEAAFNELLAADRAYSELASRKGSLAGFSEMFSPDVHAFIAPVPGFSQNRSDALVMLSKGLQAHIEASTSSWTPLWGGLSADGQHGFTLGYITTQVTASEALAAKYLSYWVKKPSGWQVALYKRVPAEASDLKTGARKPLLPTQLRCGDGPADPEDSIRSLAETEARFSAESQMAGLRAGFSKFGRADSIHIGAAADLAVGAAAIAEGQPEGPSPVRWAADYTLVASSGDLGVNWGMLHRSGPTPPGRLSEIPYFTIWYRGHSTEPWRYVAE